MGNIINNIVLTLYMTDGNWTYCDDHFAMYTNVKSICCTLETNIIVYVNYTLINLKKEETMILLLHVNKEVLCTFLGGTL